MGLITRAFAVINSETKAIVSDYEDGQLAIFITEKQAAKVLLEYHKANPNKNFSICPIKIPIHWV